MCRLYYISEQYFAQKKTPEPIDASFGTVNKVNKVTRHAMIPNLPI